MIREVPAAPSLPWVGKGRGDLGRIKIAKRNLSGLEGASHTPAQAGKGKHQQGGHGGGDGSSWGTRGEGEETAAGSRGARLGYGEGSSLHPAQKKNSETPPKPPPATLDTTRRFPGGDGKAATSPVLPL